MSNERHHRNMRYDLTGPCKDCPFLKATPFHEGILKSLPQLVSAADLGTLIHTCHKTDPLSDSEEGQNFKGPLQHCGGLLTMIAKDSELLGVGQIVAIEDGRWDPLKMKTESPVWDSLTQMIRFYFGKAEKLLAKLKTGDTKNEDNNSVVITHVRYDNGVRVRSTSKALCKKSNP